MKEFLEKLFSSDFMPHGYCYLWNPGLVWLHVISDALIAIAYFSIPFTLIYFIRKRRDLPFHWMFVCFGMFILACGGTHTMEVWTLWHANYWLSGAIKAVTAMVSVPTAILLVRLVPQAVSLPSPEAMRLEIAERKRTEQALREAKDELEAINKELEAFAYSVSHDLRAPLRHMIGFTELLQKGASSQLDDKGRRYTSVILESAKRMGTLIDDLLAFSRIGRAETRETMVSLVQLVREAQNDVSRETDGRNVNWKIGPLPDLYGDRSMLKLVLINLISNAIKFTRTRQTPEIEIGCTDKNPDTVVLFVRDNGVGFDMKYVNKLFGVFQRLHRADEFEGTGIGLATVQRIIHRHGGQVWAEGQVDSGATFYFSLPKP
ncbi:MAG TPA: ATP-binding protein [Candidatus Acidoferrum sp.]